MTGIEVDFLSDGGQTAIDVADRLSAFVGRASRTLDVAIYDFHARSGATARVADALEAAAARGVRVRVAFNQERRSDASHETPMTADPEVIDGLEVTTKGIQGQGALMHHKYAVLDGDTVWTGSTNWTDDAFSREENVIVRISAPEIASSFSENFERLWDREHVEQSGGAGTDVALEAGVSIQPLFSPRGPSLAHRIAARMAAADRLRILSPVITSGAVLGTLAELAGRTSFDLIGAYDATQMHEVVGQWRGWPPNHWKVSAWDVIRPRLSGKISTPWSAAGGVHDFMHAKITVADGEVLTGSYNLSRGGEDNAENLLHIKNGPLADRYAAFVEQVAARYRSAGAPPSTPLTH